MSKLFLELLNLSIMAGWLILAVLVVRICFKKAPKYIRCILWGLVGLRLMFPFSIESIFSLVPSGKVIEPEIVYDLNPAINSGSGVIDNTTNQLMMDSFAPDMQNSVNPLQIVTFIASNLWVLGVIVMLIYCAISYILVRRKVFDAVKKEGNVYESERVVTPFVLGIFRPRIYIPYEMDEDARNYVVEHEKAHIKRGDHISKLVGFLVLSVYWFNPLIWVAYILLCKDIELACDEKVLKSIGETQKKNYSRVLLQYSVSPKMIAACPLAFGEVAIKQRIKNVLNYKKPAFWIVAVAIVVCVVVAVCFMTSPKAETNELLPDETIAGGEEITDTQEGSSGEAIAPTKGHTNKNEETKQLLLMVDDALYYCIGLPSKEVAKCGVMDGEIETSVDEGEIPTQNNQSNFGTGYGWQRTRHNEVEVYMPYNGEKQWMRFVKEGTIPGETEFDENAVLVDTDAIFSITIRNGSNGEEIKTSRLMSDNTMRELLEHYEALEFQPFEAEVELSLQPVGWQYSMKLYDVDGNLLQTITPSQYYVQISSPGEETKVYDSSMNDTTYLLLQYMNLKFHPINGINGVYGILDKVDEDGFSLSFWNTTDEDIQYGEAYTLWVENNGEWEMVPTVVDEWAFVDVAYIVSAHGSGGWSTYWTWLYGTLEEGKRYKLTMDLMEQDENGKWIMHSQEFEFIL